MQVKTADADLNRISLDRVLYVGGEYRAGAGQSFAIVNPATEAVIGYGASATDEEVDEANRDRKPGSKKAGSSLARWHGPKRCMRWRLS